LTRAARIVPVTSTFLHAFGVLGLGLVIHRRVAMGAGGVAAGRVFDADGLDAKVQRAVEHRGDAVRRVSEHGWLLVWLLCG
jgi:hypothetical protein